MKNLLLIFLILLATRAWAVESIAMIVTTAGANTFTEPDPGKMQKATLAKGKRVLVIGEEENGFFRLVTKSGQKVWIRAQDVHALNANPESEASLDADLAQPHLEPPMQRHQRRPASLGGDEMRLTFDLGLSSGSVGGFNYTEFNLGLNWYFTSFLAWRNAVFARLASGVSTVYGLDSSVRGILSLGGSELGLTAFAGPGFRFVTLGANVPFAEAGVVFKLPVLALGGGVKTFFNNWVTPNAPSDTQYFIILSGGGSL